MPVPFDQSCASVVPAPSRRRARVAMLAFAATFALTCLVLAGCGGSAPGIIYSSPTPRPAAYAYLFSKIDYPIQIPVGSADNVTLTLSPQSNILTVTPGAGRGTGVVTEPIPLPTDLRGYQDIAASVDTTAPDNAPVVWALVSPSRQSLLTSTNPADAARAYTDATFRWRVSANSAGANEVRITLHLIYVYLDGSEKSGDIQVSQAPVPIVAVQAPAASTTLLELKLPIAGISGLAGIIALLRFIYNALKTVSNVTEPVKDAAKVAQAVRGRVSAAQQSGQSDQRGRGVLTPPLPRYGPQRGPDAYPPYPQERSDAPGHASQRPWPPMPDR